MILGRRESRRTLLSGRAVSSLWLLLALGAFVVPLNADMGDEGHRLQEVLHDAGVWGPTLFLALMTALVAAGVPGILFLLAASALWAAPVAVVLVLTGGLMASYIRFAVARTVGREWVEGRLPNRLRQLEIRLSAGGLRTVIVLRLLSNMAAPSDWLLGLSRIDTTEFILGTLIGRLPVTIALVAAGGSVVGWLTDVPARPWMAALAVVLVVVAFRHRSATPRRA